LNMSGAVVPKKVSTVATFFPVLYNNPKMANFKNSRLFRMYQNLRRKVLWKFIYNKIYRDDHQYLFKTLNYGYAFPGHPDGIGPDTDRRHPLSEVYGYQLYSAVLDHGSLRDGMKVLEVGCGTGHGIADLAAANSSVHFTGLDFSHHSIRRAAMNFKGIDNVRFAEGNAMDLPIDDGSTDLVINIESSHCYSDLEQFFSEVKRVLKPGGVFLIADFRQPRNLILLRDSARKFFSLTSEQDISDNVVKSLEFLTPYRKKIFDEYFRKRHIKRFLAKKLLVRFSGIRGSTTFDRFKHGFWKYFIVVLRKEG